MCQVRISSSRSSDLETLQMCFYLSKQEPHLTSEVRTTEGNILNSQSGGLLEKIMHLHEQSTGVNRFVIPQ